MFLFVPGGLSSLKTEQAWLIGIPYPVNSRL